MTTLSNGSPGAPARTGREAATSPARTGEAAA
jgi:hypothetical protein